MLGSGRLEERVVDTALHVARQQGVEDVLRRGLEVVQREDLALGGGLLGDLFEACGVGETLDPDAVLTAELEMKYSGYSSRLSGSSRSSSAVCVIIETNSVKTMWSSSTPPSAVSFSMASISGPATFLASAYVGSSVKPDHDSEILRSRKL